MTEKRSAPYILRSWRRVRPWILLGALLPAALGACGEPGPEVGEREATLTRPVFDSAVRHLAALPYLPWKYTTDGCYARALYFTMTLAANGIPSNHLYIEKLDGNHAIGGAWNFHVAPMVTVDEEGGAAYILDPIYNQSQAIPLASWVTRQVPWDVSTDGWPYLSVHPGNTYRKEYQRHKMVGNPYAPNPGSTREPTLAEMDPFHISNINSACHVMHTYIERETVTDETQQGIKHWQLGHQTRWLVDRLKQRGLLDQEAQADDRCLADDRARGPAGCPVDDGVTNPRSEGCCLTSVHFCWSQSRAECLAPGSRVGDYLCDVGGNWFLGASAPPPPVTAIAVGGQVRVAAEVNFRQTPSLAGAVLESLPVGTFLMVIGGSIVADGYTWWQLRKSDGTVGWCAERSASTFFLTALAG